MNNPKFRDEKFTQLYNVSFAEDELIKYKIYAYMSMNLVETIYDRKDDKALYETWSVVILDEYRLHREWLKEEGSKRKFKEPFLTFLGDVVEPTIKNHNSPDSDTPDCGEWDDGQRPSEKNHR